MLDEPQIPPSDDAVSLAEELARQLQLTTGERKLELIFANGVLYRAFVHHGPLKPEQLKALEG